MPYMHGSVLVTAFVLHASLPMSRRHSSIQLVSTAHLHPVHSPLGRSGSSASPPCGSQTPRASRALCTIANRAGADGRYESCWHLDSTRDLARVAIMQVSALGLHVHMLCTNGDKARIQSCKRSLMASMLGVAFRSWPHGRARTDPALPHQLSYLQPAQPPSPAPPDTEPVWSHQSSHLATLSWRSAEQSSCPQTNIWFPFILISQPATAIHHRAAYSCLLPHLP